MTSPFARPPAQSQLRLPPDIFHHIISILLVSQSNRRLSALMTTSQELYHLISPLLYGQITLSKRKEEVLFRGIWDGMVKTKHGVDIRVEDVVQPHLSILKRMRKRLERKASALSNTSQPKYTISRLLHPFDTPLIDRKCALFAHTHTLILQTLPSREMIYRLYDHSLQSLTPIFPNSKRLVITGEAAWQWETDPAYKRGRETLLIVLAHFGQFKHLSIHHNSTTVAKDQFLNIHPVVQSPYPDMEPRRIIAKHVSLNLDFAPTDLETCCFHGVISQYLKIPKRVKRVTIWFRACNCGYEMRNPFGDCPDHVVFEERKEQIVKVLRGCEGVERVDFVDADRVLGGLRDGEGLEVLREMVARMEGVRGRVTFLRSQEAGRCECQS